MRKQSLVFFKASGGKKNFTPKASEKTNHEALNEQYLRLSKNLEKPENYFEFLALREKLANVHADSEIQKEKKASLKN